MTDSQKTTVISQVIEAITLLVDAKIHYERARRLIGGEYASPDDVNAAEERLATMLGGLLP